MNFDYPHASKWKPVNHGSLKQAFIGETSKYRETTSSQNDEEPGFAGHGQSPQDTVGPIPKKKRQKNTISCNFCAAEFTTKQALCKHKYRKHKEEHQQDRHHKQQRKCPLCSEFRCSTVKQLNIHLNSKHQQNARTNLKNFTSFDEFLEWKKNQEKSTNAWFIQRSGPNESKESTKLYYYCNRSGVFKSKGQDKRSLKSQGSSRIGCCCAAFIVATISKSTSHVSVEYCFCHTGHSMTMAHLRISNESKLEIADKLSKGVAVEKILDDIRDNVTSICRDTLTTKRDILNIKHQYYVDGVEQHSNDRTSVGVLVEEFSKEAYNPIIYFKQGVKNNRHSEQDVLIGIQTEFQRDLMRRYGTHAITMDSTSKTNQSDFYLTTLLVLDEYGEGQPVGFLISNKEDAESLVPFLEAVRENVGEFQAEHFMSDLAGASYDAWTQVFPKPTHRWYCSWHVDRQWRRKLKELIKDSKVQAETYTYLQLLQYEKKEGDFRKKLQEFLSWVSENAKPFHKYFTSTYVDNEKIKLWALCFRMGLIAPNTNMNVDSFHRLLQDFCVGRKQNKRLDHLISVLLKTARDLVFEHLIKSEKGKCTHRHTETMKRHRSGQTITDIDMQDVDLWKVKSTEDENLWYEVRRVNDDCTCKVLCTKCNVCFHKYTCTCADYLLHNYMCKHCHAVHMSQMTPVFSNTESVAESEPVNIECYERVMRCDGDADENLGGVRSEVLKIISSITDLTKQASSVEVLNGMKKYLNAALAVGSGHGTK
ncbi:uncharacterized protein LOC115437873 isoform X2 [Sphaeramia orbicularis]|uniref:uncharacterized protein LOC115437873 isoform X2 n=1 Tax=Sphaeramia orbicularis TaxID=375764 RepID=UPI00117D0275|nr:uncharacterized protein LOC115437873 isoform X2 [Sphaeramia orbicularis]